MVASKNYVIGYWKKGNKKCSFFDVEATSLEEVRRYVWHTVRKERISTVGEIVAMLKMRKDKSFPDEAKVIEIFRDGATKVSQIGAVLLVPGVGTFWNVKKDGTNVFYDLDYKGKIVGKPSRRL